MKIIIDDLKKIKVFRLLEEHLHGMAENSPAESMHALDVKSLRKPEITFWTGWENDELLGCCALKEIDPVHAEIKSMRTSSKHLRKGVAKKLLKHILLEAESRGYKRLSLETGSTETFEAARILYTDFGFSNCKPFADYNIDNHSVFMTKIL
ncbi:MAG: GNAT family N-acetyltransferase [Desulfobacterales bacterium]|nr:GNAT family N-acetyltransferase [Desulfobacterales bacterium]